MRKRFWLTMGCLGLACPAQAGEAYFAERFWSHTWKGTREAYWGKHLAGLVLIGGPLTALVYKQDKPFQRRIQNERYGTWTRVGDVLGRPYSQAAYPGMMYLLGKATDNTRLARTSELMIESWAITVTSVHLIKPLVRRERPDGSNRLSFPSNHSAGMFSLATTLQLREGWRVGVPAYLAAGFVAFSRMAQNKHYASDTLFGAFLGINAAHAVWQLHRGAETSLTARGDGITVSWAF